ncbi:hypothetical protein D3C80_1248310 [compost metagenome]
MNAGGINTEATLNSPSTRRRHAAPVFKRIRDQRPGGNIADGVIPVAHFDGGQTDIRDRPVCAVFRHFQPVAGLEHIVGRELNTGNKAKNGVFKDQHQHGGHSA